MKSNAPWSVKGIERDARETAKAAAQREGMTVGEWLNQIIYSAGDPDAVPTEGDIEGLKARDLAAAIEHLSKRIATAEQKSAAAVDGLSRSLGGAVERLQRLERTEEGGGDPELADRVRVLEEKGTDRQRIEALRALERAVGQIAVQFSSAEKSTHSRLDAAERQLQAIAERIDAGGGDEAVSAVSVREAIEGMADRIARAEKIAAEASKLKAEAGESTDADFVHKTGLRLRILGDEIKRGGDQIRTLESSIARLTQQIDAAEKRSAEGVRKVAETIADLREQFSGADGADQAAARAEFEAAVSEITQRTEDRIEHLQKSFDDMVRRLETAGSDTAPIADAADAAAGPEPAPRPVARKIEQVKTAAKSDIDQELEDAFAALELEEPIPTPVARPERDEVAPPVAVATTETTAAADKDGDFDFDADDNTETADVLAEIREAFGIDGPSVKADAPAEDEDAADVEETDGEDVVESPVDELPPVIADAPAKSDAEGRADYLKAARQAAREAAARAAAEESADAKRKKLSPRQRAILAARAKRRKAQADAEQRGEELKAAPIPAAAPVEEDSSEKTEKSDGSLKARIAAIAQKIKLKAPAKKEDDGPNLDAEGDAAPATKAAAPNIAAGASAALQQLKIKPTGGVIAVAVALLLLVAALFLLKDMFVKDRPAAAPVADAARAPATAEIARADDRLEPAAIIGDAVRPRDLYLDNISALKNATNDADARAALAKIEQAATLGHPPAQLQIGELHKLGQLYDRDLAEARMWFERAASGGNVLAMHRLGVMSARGEGGPVDLAASISWFEKAAGLGLVDSQYNLGATFHPTPDGAAGGVQDRAKAYFWYSIAAKNGDAQAGEMAAGLAASMPEGEKSAKDAEVAAWASKTPDPAANELAPAN